MVGFLVYYYSQLEDSHEDGNFIRWSSYGPEFVVSYSFLDRAGNAETNHDTYAFCPPLRDRVYRSRGDAELARFRLIEDCII